MKTEITTKELEEAMNAVLKQARKMEDSDEPEERRYGFGIHTDSGRLCNDRGSESASSLRPRKALHLRFYWMGDERRWLRIKSALWTPTSC